MTAPLGSAVLAAALVAAVAGAAASLAGWPVLGRRLLAAVFCCSGAAVALLGWAALTGDFSIAYVADHTSRAAAWPYRLGGLWGGMEGSLTLWVWLLAAHALVGVRSVARRQPALAPVAQAVLAAAVVVFLVPLVTVARPFARLAIPALDGGGLTPVLEHPAMLYHPPLLYLGATGLVVPFALTVAALAAGRLDATWLVGCRRTTLAAWVALTAAIAAGAHWAYVELGWGGFWAWDPVENAALLPWLAATAFLHSALVQERRGTVRAWNAGLVLAAFVLAALGAFLTRSGATVSVHAFAEARDVGRILLAGLTAAVAGAALLLARRRRSLGPGWSPPSLASREAALLAGTLTLLAVGVVVLFGTLAPLLSGLVLDRPMLATPRYFALFAAPLGVALAVLLGLGPLLGWDGRGGRDGRAPLRPALAAGAVASALAVGVALALGARRPGGLVLLAAAVFGATLVLAPPARRLRLGHLLAHLGAALVLAGVAGSTLGVATTVVLGPGETTTVGAYTLSLEGLTEAQGPRRRELGAVLTVERDGRTTGRLRPELHAYPNRAQPQAEAALRSTLLADLLVTPRRIDPVAGLVVVDAFVKPLVAWVWIGALLVVAGGALSLGRPYPDASGRGGGPGSGAEVAGRPAPLVASAAEAAPARGSRGGGGAMRPAAGARPARR